MKYNPKHAFVKVLKDVKINYVTSKDFIRIGTVSITFYHELDTITFRDNRLPHLWFSTPFIQPHSILFKYRWFTRYINGVISKSRTGNNEKFMRRACHDDKTDHRAA